MTEDQEGNAIDPSDHRIEDSIAQENRPLIEHLLSFDQLLIAGQAKSHCVAWTVDDLLTEIQQRDPNLASKVYLLEDCTSPVVIPNGADFTRFEKAGMHLVNATASNFLEQ